MSTSVIWLFCCWRYGVSWTCSFQHRCQVHNSKQCCSSHTHAVVTRPSSPLIGHKCAFWTNFKTSYKLNSFQFWWWYMSQVSASVEASHLHSFAQPKVRQRLCWSIVRCTTHSNPSSVEQHCSNRWSSLADKSLQAHQSLSCSRSPIDTAQLVGWTEWCNNAQQFGVERQTRTNCSRQIFCEFR